MAKFKKGDVVEQAVTPIKGTVAGFQVDQESGDVLVLVNYEVNGVTHSRYFKESDILQQK